MAEERQERNQFLAVKRPLLAVERQIVADGIQRSCGFEAFSLSYIKKELEGGLIHAPPSATTALATAGGG